MYSPLRHAPPPPPVPLWQNRRRQPEIQYKVWVVYDWNLRTTSCSLNSESTASCASARGQKEAMCLLCKILHVGHRSVKRLAIAHTDFRKCLTGSKEIVHSLWNFFWKNVNSTLACRNSESIIGHGSVLRQYHVFWKTLARSFCQIDNSDILPDNSLVNY